MNEERKQGKNKGKNKQTDEQPKIQVQKDTKWTHAQGSQWKNERRKKEKQTMNEHQNKCISDMRTQYNTLTL